MLAQVDEGTLRCTDRVVRSVRWAEPVITGNRTQQLLLPTRGGSQIFPAFGMFRERLPSCPPLASSEIVPHGTAARQELPNNPPCLPRDRDGVA